MRNGLLKSKSLKSQVEMFFLSNEREMESTYKIVTTTVAHYWR